MTSLARLSLANRALVALVAVIATAFGIYAIPSLKQELLPSLEFPAAVVVAPFPGANPELVEEQVAKPIETAVRGVAGVTDVTSTSRDGSATVQVQFDFGLPVADVVNDLQQALTRIRAQLPQGVDPQVIAGSTDNLPAVVLAVSSDTDQRELADQVTRTVVPELQAIAGVREAAVTGARKQNITITPDQAKLAAAKVAPTAIPEALRSNGISIPAGTLTEADKSLSVQVGGKLSTLDEVRELRVSGARLGDVAAVEQAPAPATSITRTNGKDSLGISMTLAPDGNAVALSHAVRDKLPQLAATLGSGAALTIVFDQAPFVEKSIEGLTSEGALGLLFAVLVILVFLFSLRSTLVTAVSIPLSVLVALIALWIGDYSLNVLTLGGLTIAIGRVVDDSIVVLENIKRHLSYGEDKRRAVLDGVREVAGAVTASTLTTVAVFLPIAVVGGLIGQLFSAFAITVTVALVASLLVSLTVIPVLAYWFLKPGKEDGPEAAERERRNVLQRVYVPILRFATRRRLVTVLIAVAVFIGTLGLVPLLQTNFIDSSGQNTLSLKQEMPVGTSLAATDAAAKKVEAVLGDLDAVETYQVTIGSQQGFAAFGGGGNPSTASFSITLKQDTDTPAVEADLRKRAEALTDAGDITVGAGGGGGGFNANTVAVSVTAADADVLRTASDQVREAVQGTSGLTDVTSDLGDSAPRVQVTLNRAAAGPLGLTDAAVGQLVSQAFRGTTITQLTIDGELQDVVLRGGPAPTDLEQVKGLPLAGGLKLGDVAAVTQVDGPVQIKRVDGDRSVSVSATATDQNIGAVTAELQKKLDALTLPAGAAFSIGGVSADQQDAFGDLGLALLVAIAIVFLIMVVTFRSLIQPLILLVSIPFAATGAIVLLLATDTALGVPALIGVLMLVGIVVTNAIVLMDLINQYRAQGMGIQEAVIEGGRRRLRPILMTAAATIFALAPMALGITGSGGFISQPLAVVVIGGLVSSTLLTLVLVPTLYTMVENTKARFGRKKPVEADEPERELVHSG
ncbi:efflux RND transporter permease subunit [Umezawaea tangerina]|uniref:HAE1 family hydrophobic/amphiphilic exporter-1 n=1 Tax=Umezawaea tangerina TaxID=84725 RepID=A0A2T0TA19_9PSEU|nr:efflux RND transporter permease subunit [Umezawaea tangerina]PRY42523.1 HAE1 family hydrophobic/amphiphilic exporter-1 [Umezawaea tangerina]